MARFLIAPDSFRGTLTSREISRIMADGLRSVLPDARIDTLVLSDGGEGTLEAYLSAGGGKLVEAAVSGPLGKPVDASYAVLEDGTAVIEMSAACGQQLAREGLHPGRATTYGVGELLLDAARRSCPKVVLGLGSSTTNDGGCGAACACGVRFFDRYGEPFTPTGTTLNAVDAIDVSGLDPLVRELELDVVCAVENPLCGMLGTSSAFAPTKGALPSVVAELDDNLAHLASVIRRDLGVDVADMPCGGAGGGMGAGMAAFFGARPRLGIDAVLDACGFDEMLAGTDYVVTGEGCFDAQSLRGKVVSGVARRCKEAGVPLVAVVGVMDEALVPMGEHLGVTSFIALNPANMPLSELTKHPRSRLTRAMAHLGSLIARGDGLPPLVAPAPYRES